MAEVPAPSTNTVGPGPVCHFERALVIVSSTKGAQRNSTRKLSAPLSQERLLLSCVLCLWLSSHMVAGSCPASSHLLVALYSCLTLSSPTYTRWFFFPQKLLYRKQRSLSVLVYRCIMHPHGCHWDPLYMPSFNKPLQGVTP